MEENNSYSSNSANYLFLIWLVLFVAKITGHIDWSWWYVNIPLYPFALAAVIVMVAACLVCAIGAIGLLGILIVCLYESISKRL